MVSEFMHNGSLQTLLNAEAERRERRKMLRGYKEMRKRGSHSSLRSTDSNHSGSPGDGSGGGVGEEDDLLDRLTASLSLLQSRLDRTSRESDSIVPLSSHDCSNSNSDMEELDDEARG